MDHVTLKKRELRRDTHMREDYTPVKDMHIKSSAFIGAKSQGGGIYQVSTQSYSALQTYVREKTLKDSQLGRYQSAAKSYKNFDDYISPVK